ncbi:unnamed protein product [Mucor hiemalis]
MRNQALSIVTSLREELTCALCQDVYDKPQALMPCLHTFCLDCVNSIPRDYNDCFACPNCRRQVSGFIRHYSIQNIIEIFKRAEVNLSEDMKNDSRPSTPTKVIESLNIDVGESSSSSSPPTALASTSRGRKKPCRSCIRGNGTRYTCDYPITEEAQSGVGHLLCGFCSEYMPARGQRGTEPDLNQCCSFCGIIACDEYWGCKNRGTEAKLHILGEISAVKQYLVDIDQIDALEDGHLNLTEIRLLEGYLDRCQVSWNQAWMSCLKDFNDNHYTTAIARRMTPLAYQLYNTRRLMTATELENIRDNEESEDEYGDGYYDRIDEEGILPSNHLRACYGCMVTIVNGQFYGYWQEIVNHRLASDYRDKCPQGIHCETQWRTETHAERLSHVEATGRH